MKNKRIIKTGFTSLFLSMLIAGCSSGVTHLPSPLELPGAIMGSAIENAAYGAKRKKVEAYVARNYLGIREDVNNGGGRYLEGALDSANVKKNKRDSARAMIIQSKKQTFYNAGLVSDALIHAFSAIYVNSSSAQDKRINGFEYGEARQVIRHFAETNFENLRQDIKNGDGRVLNQLALALRMDEPQARASFIKKSKQFYTRIYLEPVVVAFMVQG